MARLVSKGLGLEETAQFEGAVLSLPPLLARTGGGLSHTGTPQSVRGLKLFGGRQTIVNHTEPGALSTSKLGGKTKQENRRRIRHLIHLCELLRQLGLRHVSATRVQDIDDLYASVVGE